MPSHRRSLRLSRSLAAGVAALALAAPAAHARPTQDPAVLSSAHHVIAAHGIGRRQRRGQTRRWRTSWSARPIARRPAVARLLRPRSWHTRPS